jgi:hypothetical protein
VSTDRLLVGTPDEARPNRLVDTHGHVVATFQPVGGQAVWIGPQYRLAGAPCFITQAGVKLTVRGGDVSLRDAETGRVRAQLSGSSLIAPTPDGCTAVNDVGERAEAALDGKVHAFPPYWAVAAISPDLNFVVASGRPRAGDSTERAVVDVKSGSRTPVPAGIYTWVSGAAP